MRPDNRVHSKLSDHGVTIIEALMVMAVVGFIMALLAVLASTGVTAWQKQSIRIQMESQSQAFMYLLTQKLRQAQPGTADDLPGRRGGAVETLEQVLLLSPEGCRAADLDQAGAGVPRDAGPDLPALGGELDRVGQQVDQELAGAQPVSPGGHGRAAVHREVDPLLLRGDREERHALPGRIGHIDVTVLDADLPRGRWLVCGGPPRSP